MVERKEYLDKLYSWKDEQIIKVVTGIRRSGKSTLLAQYRGRLLSEGITRDRIIDINFEEIQNEEYLDYKNLYNYIVSRLSDKRTYIFLDEIQNVPHFEKAVDSLFIKENTDIYITGSNSYMLSSDLATLLSGRYVEIHMLPLSFSEYACLTGNKGDAGFTDYMKFGGFPYTASMKRDAENALDEKINLYLDGIYNTVIVKDIWERMNKKDDDRPKRSVTDVSLLKTIARFLASVVGNPVSFNNITGYMTSTGRKVSQNTVSDYVEALTDAFIFYPAERFDITGKEILKTNKKFYIVDLGLRNYILPRKTYDLGFSIENMVYFELLRRGYKVNIGKCGIYEVDFVAQKAGETIYCQVTTDMTSPETFEREIRPLKMINDNFEKIILTLDRFTLGNYDGIKVVNVVDWMSGK